MARPTFPLYDRILGGRLLAVLTRYRSDEGLTYAQIARRLEVDHDIEVTDETVRTWCRENDIVITKSKAAS